MKRRRFLIPVAVVAVVLALLVAGLYQSRGPDWQPMPEYLTTPSKEDRSKIPLGSYTADFTGLMGGTTAKDGVSFYLVMRPSDVHLQKVGEVGLKLRGASVIGLDIGYRASYSPPPRAQHGTRLIDGLLLIPNTVYTSPTFEAPTAIDASGKPIHIRCYLAESGQEWLAEKQTFRGIDRGFCTATFWFSPDLFASLDGIQPHMFPHMAEFLPRVYNIVSERIQGKQ